MFDKPNGNWVKLSREVFSHSVADDLPWCQGFAWLYLVAMASHQSHVVYYRKRSIKLERGQLAIVMEDFRRKAGWKSKGKVQRFLNSLKRQDMITTSGTPSCTVVSIANYTKWQSGLKADTQTDTLIDTLRDTLTDKPTMTVETPPDTLRDTLTDTLTGQQNKNGVTRRVLQEVKDLKSSPLPKSSDQTNFQGFQDAWTSICVSAGLHGVRDWTTWHERIRRAWNRIAASKDSSWSALSPLERICDLFTHAAKIPFLAGDNSRKWKADLEFVLRPLSIDRIMGGYYCDMVQSEPSKPIPIWTPEQDAAHINPDDAWRAEQEQLLHPGKAKEEAR